jgi:hypothetical protein
VKTELNLGPGVICNLSDTPDGCGIDISIEGTFRHGGMTHKEIGGRLVECFQCLDIDY